MRSFMTDKDYAERIYQKVKNRYPGISKPVVFRIIKYINKMMVYYIRRRYDIRAQLFTIKYVKWKKQS